MCALKRCIKISDHSTPHSQGPRLPQARSRMRARVCVCVLVCVLCRGMCLLAPISKWRLLYYYYSSPFSKVCLLGEKKGLRDEVKKEEGGGPADSGYEICRLQCVSLLPVALSSHFCQVRRLRDKRATVGAGEVRREKKKKDKEGKKSEKQL